MILHLISDDKFADYAINQFSEIDDNSHFVIIDYKKSDLKYIKNKDKVLVVESDSENYFEFVKQINNYSALVLHGFFSPLQEKVMSFVSKEIKIAWIFWGGEIYGRPDLKMQFLSTKSKLLFYSRTIKKCLNGTHKETGHFFVDINSYQAIQYCLTDVYEDFEFVGKYTNSPMQELWYNYYSIEETLGTLTNKTVNSNNILIGNSCTLENNHLDVFNVLRKFNLNNRKLIVPLSYGETWLKNILLKTGASIWGHKFQPLVDFMERDSYNQYLLSCSIVVMNHYRPQAMGNIITALWLGAKVYMSKKSLLFSYYKRLGIFVFSIEDDLKPTNKLALHALENGKVEQNREILMREYGRENMMVRIREIVRVLNN